jgi:hypothetical protein
MPWIFRSAEPVVERLGSSGSDEWTVRQHTSLMGPGDLVFFWEGGDDGSLVGVGKIQTQAYRDKDDFRRMLIRVGRNHLLKHPVTAVECREHPVLAELSVLSRPNHTNFGLSRKVTNNIVSLIAGREPGFAKALNLRPDQFAEPVEPPPPAEEAPKDEVEESAATDSATPVYVSDMDDRVTRFRDDAVAQTALALRKVAHERLRGFLTPDVLAEVVPEQFESELARFGSVTLMGIETDFWDAVGTLRGTEPVEINRLASEGSLTTRGNLTWGGYEAETESEEDMAALRLRAGLAHLLSDDRSLKSRIARLRRSVPMLWPDTATGILMILNPRDYIVYQRPSVLGLGEIGIQETFHDRLEDYERYLALVRDIMERYEFSSLEEVDLFLTLQAEPRPVTQSPIETIEVVDEVAPVAQPIERSANVEISSNPGSETAAQPMSDEGQAVFALYQHLRHDGVVVTLEQVVNLYLSLKTVPMMALQGPSGTGKNHVIRAIAEASGSQFHWMPMTNETGRGPADAPIRLRDLFGVIDSRTGEYCPEPWYDALVAAHENPERAVIVCADTPDGWQEDPWFSEWLRVQDSRVCDAEGCWNTLPLVIVPGRSNVQTSDGHLIEGSLPLPDNLFLVLTGIGDAGFGDIVAEHTNVVEFGNANLGVEALSPPHVRDVIAPTNLGGMLVGERGFRDIRTITARSWFEEWNDEIEEVAGILESVDISLGYRLRDEMMRYLAYADELSGSLPYGAGFPLEVAFDYQIAQRIVPRLAMREPDEEVLSEFIMYTQGEHGNTPRFPKATGRIEALQNRMEQ